MLVTPSEVLDQVYDLSLLIDGCLDVGAVDHHAIDKLVGAHVGEPIVRARDAGGGLAGDPVTA